MLRNAISAVITLCLCGIILCLMSAIPPKDCPKAYPKAAAEPGSPCRLSCCNDKVAVHDVVRAKQIILVDDAGYNVVEIGSYGSSTGLWISEPGGKRACVAVSFTKGQGPTVCIYGRPDRAALPDVALGSGGVQFRTGNGTGPSNVVTIDAETAARLVTAKGCAKSCPKATAGLCSMCGKCPECCTCHAMCSDCGAKVCPCCGTCPCCRHAKAKAKSNCRCSDCPVAKGKAARCTCEGECTCWRGKCSCSKPRPHAVVPVLPASPLSYARGADPDCGCGGSGEPCPCGPDACRCASRL